MGRGCRCLDLGFTLSETCVSWPTCQPLSRQLLKSPQSSAPPGARSKQAFSLNGGTGTHLDAPSHFIPNGRTVEQLRPDELINVPLAVIDARPTSTHTAAATATPTAATAATAATAVHTNATHVGKRTRDEDAAATSIASPPAPVSELDCDYLLSRAAIEADEKTHGPISPHALVRARLNPRQLQQTCEGGCVFGSRSDRRCAFVQGGRPHATTHALLTTTSLTARRLTRPLELRVCTSPGSTPKLQATLCTNGSVWASASTPCRLMAVRAVSIRTPR